MASQLREHLRLREFQNKVLMEVFERNKEEKAF
jgi:hypothetical protein